MMLQMNIQINNDNHFITLNNVAKFNIITGDFLTIQSFVDNLDTKSNTNKYNLECYIDESMEYGISFTDYYKQFKSDIKDAIKSNKHHFFWTQSLEVLLTVSKVCKEMALTDKDFCLYSIVNDGNAIVVNNYSYFDVENSIQITINRDIRK